MSRETSLLKNTLILGFGKLSSQIIGFLLLPLYTAYLSPDEYGYVDVAIVYLSLLVPSVTLQLNMASFRFLMDVRGDKFGTTRVISNIIYLVIALGLPWILIFLTAGYFLGLNFTGLIVATGLSMLLSDLVLQIARGLGHNLKYAIASILIGISTLATAIILIPIMGWRIEGMLLSLIIANSVAIFYVGIRLKLYKYIRSGVGDRNLRRELLGYSAPLVPNGIAWWVNNAADRVLISLFLGTAANGIYAVATKFSAILFSLFGVFSMSWTESASLYINDKDRDSFFSKVANVTVRVFGSLGLFLISVMPLLFPLMVSDNFAEAYVYIPVMVVGVFFNVLVGFYSAIYIAKKLTGKVMVTSIVAAIINIILTLTLLPLLGLLGAAIATVLAFLCMTIVRHFDVKKYVKITYDWKVFVALSILATVILYCYYHDLLWVNAIGLLLAVAFGGLMNHKEIRRFCQLGWRAFRRFRSDQ